jgi:integrase
MKGEKLNDQEPQRNASIVDDIVAFENGELSQAETAAMFQTMIDDGSVWKLQGSYGRMGRIYVRGGRYYADYYDGHKRIRKSLGKIARKDAVTILRALEGRAARAECGIHDNNYPIADLRRSYEALAQQTLRPATLRRNQTALDSILGYLNADEVSDITPDAVIAYRQCRLATTIKHTKRTYSRRSVNLEVGSLKTMFNYGVRHQLICNNPIGSLSPLKYDVPFKERRALTVDEVQAILDAATDHYRPVWRALLTTGMRVSELAGLRFRDVDWGTREFIVRSRTAKNHTERRIPIEDADVWADLLKRRKTARDRQPGLGTTAERTAQIRARFTRDHVFVTEVNTPLGNNVRPRFYETCKRAGVDVSGLEEGQGNAVDLHALRGTFATHAAQNGADIAALGEVTGHKDISVLLGHYLKAMAHTKRRAVASLPWSKPNIGIANPSIEEARPKPGTGSDSSAQAV